MVSRLFLPSLSSVGGVVLVPHFLENENLMEMRNQRKMDFKIIYISFVYNLKTACMTKLLSRYRGQQITQKHE